MSNFSSGYMLTDAGSRLMADVNAGKLTLKLTKMQLGSGKTNTVGDYATRSALIAPQNTMVITSITTEDVGDVRTCLLSASLTSEAVETGFEATELGVFAQDSAGKEILYGVCYDTEPSYVPSKYDGNNVQINFAVRIVTTSKATVELVLPKTAADLVALAQQDAAKAIDSAAAAKASADKAAELNTYTQTAMSTASSYADKAKESASNASSSASTAEEASSSASKAQSASETIRAEVERMYRSMRYDIVGTPPEYMTIANFIVGADAAEMSS
ncbi:MAG: phage tail protein [Selenomonadaceae bacterium]|nr:phage tail protein [Selenomonadaceae bacterium]